MKTIKKDETHYRITYNSPEEFINYVENMNLKSGNLLMVEEAIKNTNKIKEDYKKDYNENHPGLEALRRKLYREKEELIKLNGTVTIPAVVRRNINTTIESIKGMEIEVEGGIGIEKAFVNELGKREALWALDCIQTYVSDYRENKNTDIMKAVELDSLNPFYVINDTFDNFCKRGRIEGRNKRTIKEYLFDKKKEYGPFNRVSLVVPADNGKHTIIDVNFISITLIERKPKLEYRAKDQYGKFIEQAEDGSKEEFYKIDRFQMILNYNLYNYVEEKRKHQATPSNLLPLAHMGYSTLPKAFTYKIESFLGTLKKMAKDPDIEAENITGINRALAKDFDVFVRGMHYVQEKWIRGYEKREKFMLVSWKELQINSQFPRHKKKSPNYKYSDLDVLSRLIREFILTDKTSFPNCVNAWSISHFGRIPTELISEIKERDPTIQLPFLLLVVDPEIIKSRQESKKLDQAVEKAVKKTRAYKGKGRQKKT